MLIGRVRTATGETVHVRRDGEALRAIEDPYAAHAAGRLPADLETVGEGTGDVLAPSYRRWSSASRRMGRTTRARAGLVEEPAHRRRERHGCDAPS